MNEHCRTVVTKIFVWSHVLGLRAHNGRILKPFQSKQRGERERDFYERVFTSTTNVPEFAVLRDFLPAYFGTMVVPGATDDKEETTSVKEQLHGGTKPWRELLLDLTSTVLIATFVQNFWYWRTWRMADHRPALWMSKWVRTLTKRTRQSRRLLMRSPSSRYKRQQGSVSKASKSSIHSNSAISSLTKTLVVVSHRWTSLLRPSNATFHRTTRPRLSSCWKR